MICHWIDTIVSEIKWGFQRMFRGWDDRVTWGIDYYLAKYLPVWLRVIKKRKDSVPFDFFNPEDLNSDGHPTEQGMLAGERRYNLAIDKVIEGFEAYNRIEEYSSKEWFPETYESLYKKFEDGLEIFYKNFIHFGW